MYSVVNRVVLMCSCVLVCLILTLETGNAGAFLTFFQNAANC